MMQKAKKRKSRIGILLTILMLVIAAFVYRYAMTPLPPGNQHIYGKVYAIQGKEDDKQTVPAPPPKEPEVTLSLSPEQLNSSHAILIRLTDQAVLLQKNSDEKIYPASLTKIMTALVAIENLPDRNAQIKLAGSMFAGLYEANAAMAGFQPGERVRALDLLYGAMLPSGAECCIALADYIAGSERNFVQLMNQKAAELGMQNTHFENATGLHHQHHYTTVEDLAILLSQALQNDIFREIFTTFRHSTPPTNIHPDGITFYSTLYEGLGGQNIINGEILGGKTGYTDEAGLCLTSLAKVGRQEYMLITAGAKGNPHTEQYHITDALAVYNSLRE